MAHQEKGSVLIPVLEPIQTLIGDDIRDIAGFGALFAHFDHDRVEIIPLAGQDGPIVKPGRFMGLSFAQMPLADHRRLIA